MAKGYWIARVDVTDPEQYQKYIEADAEPFAMFGARFPVRGGRFEAPEGTPRSRNIVIEFESYETALACYNSPEYQAAKAHRDGACDADFLVIEGYDDANAKPHPDSAAPKGYWVARVDVSDPDQYMNYVEANAAPFAEYNARFIVRGGQFENPEGTSRARNVVLEFPSYDDAAACYHSEGYQAAKAKRDGASVADIIIIEGHSA